MYLPVQFIWRKILVYCCHQLCDKTAKNQAPDLHFIWPYFLDSLKRTLSLLFSPVGSDTTKYSLITLWIYYILQTDHLNNRTTFPCYKIKDLNRFIVLSELKKVKYIYIYSVYIYIVKLISIIESLVEQYANFSDDQ